MLATNITKMVLSGLGVASLFALVLMGKMDALEYQDLIIAVVFGGVGHAVGKSSTVNPPQAEP